jgi:flagellar assembly protein FliH
VSSPVIPKERLTAFQRWELASFDDADQEPAPLADDPAPPDHTDLLEAAQTQGYADGYARGLADGQAQIAARVAQLNALMQGLRTELAAAPFTLADDTLELALDLAQTLVRGTLAVEPARILPVVEEALASLPRVLQPATLALHPDDARLVREHLAADLTAWRLRDDASLARGGCRIETAESRVDASLEQRWEKLNRALGKPGVWQKARTPPAAPAESFATPADPPAALAEPFAALAEPLQGETNAAGRAQAQLHSDSPVHADGRDAIDSRDARDAIVTRVAIDTAANAG